MFRSAKRTLGPETVRDIALVCGASVLLGMSFGAIAVGTGFPVWAPSLLSVIVFAGTSQFIFVGLVAAGSGPLTAVLAGLLVNVRHLPYGLAVGDAMGRGWWQRLLGAHLLTDEAAAFALAQNAPARRTAAFWTSALGVFGSWNAGVIVGALAGTAITDTDAFGLDAAFPAALLALILPSLKDRAMRCAALTGSAIALAATPFLPTGVPVLLSLIAVLPLLRARPAERARAVETSRLDEGAAT
ncbi:AzlC family ABC transporter permease [Thermostaphylospora chromogena]|uniref:4-azaleucine resistance probable transporter AzlC n=1 Tax=Thermostaphylospora chromogena TaxID=35622 RepID=A0A1H1GH96_9ACTN|nr:AzlC family ABC transporter permease [Thermostaphylospora chromogena]SDR12485.1 4-azaleucine resistance probable transporter AzlC [Thermostaphylospora chromogena]